jgi:hypothetical protein
LSRRTRPRARVPASTVCANSVRLNERRPVEDVRRAVAEWLPLFFRPDDVLEVRFLGVRRQGRTAAGWLRAGRIPALAGTIASYGDLSNAVYFTPQRLRADVLGRSRPELFAIVFRDGAKCRPELTGDADVLGRRFLIVDVDPVRPAGVSATDAEKEAARHVAASVKSPWWACSRPARRRFGERVPPVLPAPGRAAGRAGRRGNRSARPAARRPGPPVRHAGRQGRYAGYNASRIVKVPGTWARKGPNTTARPHRQSPLLRCRMIGGECLPDWLARTSTPSTRTARSGRPSTPPAARPRPWRPASCRPDDVRAKRARAYLAAMPAGVQGQNGSGATYSAACAMVHGFALDPDAALEPVARRLQPAVRSAVVGPRAVAQGRGRRPEGTRRTAGLLARPRPGRRARGHRPERPAPSAPRPSPPRPVGQWWATRGRLRPGRVLEHDDDPYRIARGILAGYGTPGPAGRWPTGVASSTRGTGRGGRSATGAGGRRPSTWRPAGTFEAVYKVQSKARGPGTDRGRPEDGPGDPAAGVERGRGPGGRDAARRAGGPGVDPRRVGPGPGRAGRGRERNRHLPASSRRADAILDPTPVLQPERGRVPGRRRRPAAGRLAAVPGRPLAGRRRVVALLQEWFGYLSRPTRRNRKCCS